jgi:hypothetical protein
MTNARYSPGWVSSKTGFYGGTWLTLIHGVQAYPFPSPAFVGIADQKMSCLRLINDRWLEYHQ